MKRNTQSCQGRRFLDGSLSRHRWGCLKAAFPPFQYLAVERMLYWEHLGSVLLSILPYLCPTSLGMPTWRFKTMTHTLIISHLDRTIRHSSQNVFTDVANFTLQMFDRLPLFIHDSQLWANHWFCLGSTWNVYNACGTGSHPFFPKATKEQKHYWPV